MLYYKFILYITRGAPNKATKKKIPTISMVIKVHIRQLKWRQTTQRWVKSVTARKKGANTVTKTDTDMGLFSIRDPKQKDLKFRQLRDKRTPPKSKRASVNKLSFIFPRETQRIRKKSQYISFVFTGEMMLYC